MSYCRWSSDDYQSDAYVWADVAGGWRVEVAGRRQILREGFTFPPSLDVPVGEANTPERTAWAEAWVERHAAVDLLLNAAREGTVWDWRTLPSPPPPADPAHLLGESGSSLHFPDTGACADYLEAMVAAGFHVPANAIAALREEATG